MGLTANPYQVYKRQDVMMASPLELIVMLYSGCIKQLKLAKMSIGDNNYDQVNESLKKAQDIVIELMMCLDFQYEVSNDLMKLYDFIIYEIVSINVSKDQAKIDPLVEILENLRSTWIQVQKDPKTKVIVSNERQ